MKKPFKITVGDYLELEHSSKAAKMAKKKKLIRTHDGKFHADEVMAVATLAWALGDVLVFRSTKPLAGITSLDVDIGRLYDPERLAFDHHDTPDICARGTDRPPLASFGMIWKAYGKAAAWAILSHAGLVTEVLNDDNSVAWFTSGKAGEMLQTLTTRFDEDAVEWLDARDTGWFRDEAICPADLTMLLATFNAKDGSSEDAGFEEAVQFAAEHILPRLVLNTAKGMISEQEFKTWLSEITQFRAWLELPKEFFRWQGHLNDCKEADGVCFAVMPIAYGGGERWKIHTLTVPDHPETLRVPIPKAWREAASFSQLSAIAPGIMLCRSRFLVVDSINTARHYMQMMIDVHERGLAKAALPNGPHKHVFSKGPSVATQKVLAAAGAGSLSGMTPLGPLLDTATASVKID